MNVIGDGFGAGIVYHFCKAELKRTPISEVIHPGEEFQALRTDGNVPKLETSLVDNNGIELTTNVIHKSSYETV